MQKAKKQEITISYSSGAFDRSEGLTFAEMQGGRISKPDEIRRRKAAGFLTDAEFEVLNEIVNLTARQKECMQLYYWQGLTQKEISKQLGIYQWVVSFHLRQARRKLIDYFGIST